MSEFLNSLISNSTTPFLTAALLGLMTAISPCPLATNITAVGYISKDVENKRKVFINGMVYTLGRAVSYTLIAVIIFIGADQFRISGVFQKYGEKIIGPLLQPEYLCSFLPGLLPLQYQALASCTTG